MPNDATVLILTLIWLHTCSDFRIERGPFVSDLERLEQAWLKAGYPKEYVPKAQFAKAAGPVAEAFAAGAEDFLKAGWTKAGVDYPFSPSHPRYQLMLTAYRELGQSPAG